MTTGSTDSATAVAAQPVVRVERALCSRFRCREEYEQKMRDLAGGRR